MKKAKVKQETEPSKEIVVSNKPIDLINIATDVANVCRAIIEKTVSNIQGKRYVKVEGWEAIAAAHGCAAGADTAIRDYDNKGELIGYTAKGYVRNAQGNVIATGEGFVGLDEKKWGKSPEYSCRAMAQTRAISRACRSVFAHVIVLIGGIETTPAEEIPYDDHSEAPEQQKYDRSGRTTPLKSEDGSKLREMGLKALRAFLVEVGIKESFVMELCHNSGLADGSEATLDDLKDGIIERLNSEKLRARLVELAEKDKKADTLPDHTPPNAAEIGTAMKREVEGDFPPAKKEEPKKKWKREPLLLAETHISPDAAMYAGNVKKWQDVVIPHGVNKNIRLGELAPDSRKYYLNVWRPKKDNDGGYTDEDILLDAALTLAAEEGA